MPSFGFVHAEHMTLEDSLLRLHAVTEKAATCTDPRTRDAYLEELAGMRRDAYAKLGASSGWGDEC